MLEEIIPYATVPAKHLGSIGSTLDQSPHTDTIRAHEQAVAVHPQNVVRYCTNGARSRCATPRFYEGGGLMDLPRVIVIGAAGVDIKGRARGSLQRDTSNPSTIRFSLGGVARNIAENLARLGIHATLLSAVGIDYFGQRILEGTEAGGVDTSNILVSEVYPSSAYVAILDQQGNRTLSVDAMDILQLITPRHIQAHRGLLRDARMIVIDANLSARAVRSVLLTATRYDVPVAADPASAYLAPRLREYLPKLAIITPNETEAATLSGVPVTDRDSAMEAAMRLLTLGAETAIVTLGEEGLCYATADESGWVPACQCEVVDLTGAGDALTAAVVYGLVNEMPLSEALRLGVSAAALTIQCTDTVCPDLSLERLYDQLII